jgi:MOSC domain
VLRRSFLSCLAFVLELATSELPDLSNDEDPATGWTLSRWLGGLGLGLAPIRDPARFQWAGPWLARIRAPNDEQTRFAVMYGVPSGAVWDPAGDGVIDNDSIADGYLLAAGDIALARPPLPTAPDEIGTVEAIWVAPAAGAPARSLRQVNALAGRGLDGDRYVSALGTFPSGPAGSALTLIDAEVCASFDPPLHPDDHRRNLVTSGIDLNALVGHEFTVGEVRCRGMRLCEPCTVMQRYAGRPVLRALVHRGGLRADILADGEIRVGDPIRAAAETRAADPSSPLR